MTNQCVCCHVLGMKQRANINITYASRSIWNRLQLCSEFNKAMKTCLCLRYLNIEMQNLVFLF